MIDPLHSVAMPPPLRTSPNEASPGTPSFLQWALGNPLPGMEGDAFPQQNAHDPQFEVVAEPLVPDPAVLDSIAGMEAASVAPALDLMHWRERVSSVVEFHVRNPQGERELVAMPWRLMASGALAQSMDGQGPVDPAVAMVASMHAAGGFAHAAAARSVAATGHADAAGPRSEAAGSNATVQLPAMVRAAGTDDPMQLRPLPMSSPAAAEWLARWMKWIERDGRDPIVLLRDFRIDDDEARRVVDGLRAFAQEHGVGLDRIVVNGREFWRRPDPSQRQE